jgi:hypothetical protein
MKINVLSIDEDKLIDGINMFTLTQEKYPYLMMSRKTFELLQKYSSVLSRCNGFKIYFDNELNLGEINIR